MTAKRSDPKGRRRKRKARDPEAAAAEKAARKAIANAIRADMVIVTKHSQWVAFTEHICHVVLHAMEQRNPDDLEVVRFAARIAYETPEMSIKHRMQGMCLARGRLARETLRAFAAELEESAARLRPAEFS